MPGFDALGRLALGQGSDQAAVTTILLANAGAYTITGSATLARGALASVAGTYAITGNATIGKSSLLSVAGSYGIGGGAALFAARMPAAAGAYAITGQAAGGRSDFAAAAGAYAITAATAIFRDTLLAPAGSYAIAGGASLLPGTVRAEGGGYVITLGEYALARTGGAYDQVYGGVGHYLEEIERLRQLAKITRKTPAPIVHQIGPRLHSMPATPLAPRSPAIDLRAVLAQRAGQLQQQAEQAKILKRRRQEAEILLLAS